jgi:Etoposide-induced protein 2.4 (EI24)
MALMWDALWRALGNALHPRVIWLSLTPLLLSAVLLGGLAWWGWSDGVQALAQHMQQWDWLAVPLRWFGDLGFAQAPSTLAAVALLMLTAPLVVVASLLLVASFMGPTVARWVASRRFTTLELHTTPWWAALWWSVRSTALALGLMLLSLPLWLIPPLGLVLPALIWGWLTYRVMAFDVLSEHATPDERQQLLKAHRAPLLLMGVITGYLGAAPTALWAMGVLSVLLAPVMVLASVWLYTAVFVLSCLWFAHYLLAALQQLRKEALA